MSRASRLFQQLREDKGLAYSIYAMLMPWRDCGMFAVYAATARRESTAAAALVEEVLTQAAKDMSQRELDRVAEKDMTTPFDLLNGPVFRAILIKLAPEEHHLRLTGHHVLVDGWSLGIMMADISKLYSRSPLEEVTPFSDFALAVIDHAKSDDHAVTERFWLDQFSGTVPRLDLPTDKPRPRMKTYSGNRIDIELDAVK